MKSEVIESLRESIHQTLKLIPEQDRIEVLLSLLRECESVVSVDVITSQDLEGMAHSQPTHVLP